MNDFFVQIVRADGCLGKLFGPATWNEAVAKVKAYVALNGPDDGETEDFVKNLIENDGYYEWIDGGEGIFIVQSETIDAPFESESERDDEDEDEEQRRDEKNGLYGHHIDDSN